MCYACVIGRCASHVHTVVAHWCLFNVDNHSYDYGPNRTPLSSIVTIEISCEYQEKGLLISEIQKQENESRSNPLILFIYSTTFLKFAINCDKGHYFLPLCCLPS